MPLDPSLLCQTWQGSCPPDSGSPYAPEAQASPQSCTQNRDARALPAGGWPHRETPGSTGQNNSERMLSDPAIHPLGQSPEQRFSARTILPPRVHFEMSGSAFEIITTGDMFPASSAWRPGTLLTILRPAGVALTIEAYPAQMSIVLIVPYGALLGSFSNCSPNEILIPRQHCLSCGSVHVLRGELFFPRKSKICRRPSPVNR